MIEKDDQFRSKGLRISSASASLNEGDGQHRDFLRSTRWAESTVMAGDSLRQMVLPRRASSRTMASDDGRSRRRSAQPGYRWPAGRRADDRDLVAAQSCRPELRCWAVGEAVGFAKGHETL